MRNRTTRSYLAGCHSVGSNISQLPRHVVGRVVFLLLTIAAGHVSADDSRISIIRGDAGLSSFVAAAESTDKAQYGLLFEEHVYRPFHQDCSGKGETSDWSEALLKDPPEDIDAFAHVLSEVEQSDAYVRIERAVNSAIGLMPIDHVTVCVFSYPPDGQSANFIRDVMGGVMGFSEGPGIFWIQLLPFDGWLDEIGPAVAHEYFHAANHPDVRSAEPTLLDFLVNEGSADYFASLLYPDFIPEWTRALTQDQQAAVWPIMQRELNTTDIGTIQKYMFGADEIPFQAGYTIGFEIVTGYLSQHPHDPVSIWSRVEAERILEGSGYDP